MVVQTQPSLWIFVTGLGISAAGTLVLAGYTITRDPDDPTYRAFTALLVAVVVWTAGQVARLLTGPVGGKLRWQAVLYVGAVGVPVAWLVFTLTYTGRKKYVSPGTVTLLSILPATSLLALATNASHHLFYQTVDVVYVGKMAILSTVAGPYWWVSFGYSYLLIGLGIVVLVRFALSAERLYREQVIALILASLVPVAANAVFIFELLSAPVVDLTPIAFTVSMFFLFAGVFYGRFLDMVPVAYETVVQTLDDGIVVVNEEGHIVSANPAAKDMLEPRDTDASLVGRGLSTVEPTLGATDTEAVSTADTGVSQGIEAAARNGATTDWYWIREIDLTLSRSRTGSVLTLTDITEKKRFERQLRKLEQTHRRLIVAENEGQITDVAIESASDVLGLPITGVWKHEPDRGELSPVAMTDDGREVFDEQPVLRPGNSLAWEAFSSGELQTYSDLSEPSNVYNPDTPLESEIIVPIGDWGVLASGSTSPTEFDDIDFDLLRLLAAAVERALNRRKREQGIRLLQERTSSLIRKGSPEAIAQAAVDTADEALELPLSGIHLESEMDEVLEGTAVTETVRDEFGSAPTYSRTSDSPIDRLVWGVYQSGETLVVEDADETEFELDDTSAQSVIVQSLPGHGVFVTSSLEPQAFAESDLALAELFATTVTAALDRVDREQELRERERELRRQNERLEEFTSVVSHDLRSPLNQIDVYLELVVDQYDDDRLESALEANDRASEMLDDLLRLARQGKTVEDPEPGDLTGTIRDAWKSVPADSASLRVEGHIGTVAADHARLREAFENLFRNTVEHGGDIVRVGRLDDRPGVYVADDGPGIPQEMHGEVFDHGYTTNASGTGFGLAIVERIIDAHGWTISVSESASGGARFDVTGQSFSKTGPEQEG